MLGKSRRLINAERHPGACTKLSHTGHQDTCPLWGHSLLKLLFKLKHTQYRIVVAPPVPMSTCVFLPTGCRTLIDTETHTTALTVYISGDTISPPSLCIRQPYTPAGLVSHSLHHTYIQIGKSVLYTALIARCQLTKLKAKESSFHSFGLTSPEGL